MIGRSRSFRLRPRRPPPPPPPPPPEPRTHVVASGESLWSISVKYYGKGHHWRKIANANPSVDPDHLSAGTKLVVPELEGATRRTGAAASEGTPPPSPGLRSYRVKNGDSYWKIAKNELGSATRFREIEKLNPDLPSSRLSPGRTIWLPAN
jgi:nucleoid-associated protein YgaU